MTETAEQYTATEPENEPPDVWQDAFRQAMQVSTALETEIHTLRSRVGELEQYRELYFRRLVALEGIVRESFSEAKFSELFAGLAALQDAQMVPLLAASPVLVELRGIRAALEEDNRLTSGLMRMSWSGDDPQPCDCDELWRLAREYTLTLKGQPAYDALVAYVR